MYMEKPFVDLMEFILEDTLFNLMEEATYEEFDLGQPPRIYIRKDDWVLTLLALRIHYIIHSIAL